MFLALGAPQAEWNIWFHYAGEKADFSTADLSKILQLTPKQSKWTNSTTGKIKCMYFNMGLTSL